MVWPLSDGAAISANARPKQASSDLPEPVLQSKQAPLRLGRRHTRAATGQAAISRALIA
jgi:hypothetical protein